MTASNAMPREADHAEAANALQTYLTSLLYLRQEARRDGLDVVADIMWEALATIEAWLDTGSAPARSHEILDSPLCHSLDFLLKWLALPPGSQREVAQHIARYEGDTGASPAVPRSQRRVSKVTAN
jgi:hypothetical protein